MMPLAPHDIGPRDYLGLSALADRQGRTRPLRPGNRTPVSIGSKPLRSMPSSPSVRRPFAWRSRGHDSEVVEVADLSPAQCRPPLREIDRDQGNPEIWLNATVATSSSTPPPAASRASRPGASMGERLTVAADWFVLAAGTFETTRLLLQLDELTDGRAFSGCDALGRYFIDHLKIEAGRIERLDGKRTNLALRLSHRRLDPSRHPPGSQRFLADIQNIRHSRRTGSKGRGDLELLVATEKVVHNRIQRDENSLFKSSVTH